MEIDGDEARGEGKGGRILEGVTVFDERRLSADITGFSNIGVALGDDAVGLSDVATLPYVR